MEDFHAVRPEQMHYKILADKVRYLKGTEEGVSGMSRIVEEICEEVREEERKTLIETVVDMGKQWGATFDDAVAMVVKKTGLSVDVATESVRPLWFPTRDNP